MTDWDGVPKISLTIDEVSSLYEFVPRWRGTAVGPRLPFNQDGFAKIDVDAIFRDTREEATACVEEHIEAICATEHLVFDREEWTIVALSRESCS